MLFNSTEFLIFFAGFLACYWLARPSLSARNLLILVASYVFYCWWDYRFGALLLFTSLADYAFARWLENPRLVRWRRWLLGLSLTCNLGVLGFFKYFGFFAGSCQNLLQTFGVEVSQRTLELTLPVGISFYTFQSLSYVIDVYRGHTRAERNVVQVLAFVAFFPQLVAGPIERAGRLLPQFARTLRITGANLEHGAWLICWGLFQKVVLADNLAPLAELAFDRAAPSLPLLALGSLAFGAQIYCDFAGYSDIARGLARVLGFELMLNFNAPYVARSLPEFWQRWHISLSTWIRDYLYIPLGGNRRGAARTGLNLLVVLLLAGLWHGAALNFVLWGLWHGGGLAVGGAWSRWRTGRALPDGAAWLLTMAFVFAGWVLFRIPSTDHLWSAAAALADFSLPVWWKTHLLSVLVLTLPVALMHYRQFVRQEAETFRVLPRRWRMGLQGVMLLALCAWWQTESPAFIYFQF